MRVCERASRFAAPVRHLVQIVNTNCVMRGGPFESPAPVCLVFGVRESSGIDNQRPPVRRDLNVQEIIMTMTTISEWTTIEDEIALVLETRAVVTPATALNEITAIRKAPTRLRGRTTLVAIRRGVKEIIALEDLRCEFQ